MSIATTPRYDPDQISNIGNRAVVVGGSMAGLLTARILADYFKEVMIIERDRLPDEPIARRGVPQAHHPHILWEAGRSTLEDLFPGYGEELLSAGGLMIDLDRDFKAYDQGDFFAEGAKRLPIYSASRPLFEQIVRRYLFDLDGVEMRSGCQFNGYLVDRDGRDVKGVAVSEEDAGEIELTADLVVDATGRTSRTPTWLEEHGYTPPPTDEVYIDVAYSTTHIERPADDRRAYFVGPDPPRTRGGAAFPIEGGQWQVNIHGMHGDHPPTDAEGFVEFAGSLPIPHLKQLLDTNTWVAEDIEHYPFPSNLRRRYEKLDQFPDGLVVIGDAIASFNPIYGQGMSVAALEALQLHHTLSSGRREDLALRFFDRAETVVDTAWKFAIGADHQFSQTEGPKPRGTDFFNWYTSRVVQTAHTDSVVGEAFARVIMMEQPPTSLLRPGVMWRVLRTT